MSLEDIAGSFTALYLLLLYASLFLYHRFTEKVERYRYAWKRPLGYLVRSNFCRSTRHGFIDYELGEVLSGVDRFGKLVITLKNGESPALGGGYAHYYEQKSKIITTK
jgi:hypothetical protein